MKNWISNKTNKPFYARKSFCVSKMHSAWLSCVGVGQFEVLINGQKVGASVLDGSWTDYNKRIYYYSFDITPYIREGENVLMAEIANGWYIADTDEKRHFYTIDKGYEPFGNYLAFTAELSIDGEIIEADNTWEVSASCTMLANVYGSEDYDASRMLKWENASVLSTDDAPKGALIPIDYPPVVVKKIYEGKKLSGGIYDLGQNMSGMFEVTAYGDEGDMIRVTPYEKLNKNGVPEKTVNTWSVYTLKDGENVFCPRFSYAGGRWIRVEGLKGNPTVKSVRGKFITSSSDDVGFFRCSDERLNKIFDIVKASVESNLNHCHTDCPTIEKLGWLEPNHLMAPSVMYLKNVDKLWTKIAVDMRDSQYTENEYDVDNGKQLHEYGEGLVPSVAPRYAKFMTDLGSGSFWDIIPWGSSLILGAYEQYRFYGNTQVIRDNWDAAKKYINYLTKQYNDYERLYGKKGNFICAGLGDWGITQNGGNSRENIETAYFYYDLVIMSRFAQILGENDDFLQLAKSVKNNYNKVLLQYDEKNGLVCYRAYDTPNEFKVTQANQAIPLCFGLVPDENRQDVRKALVSCFLDGHFKAGEIGMPYIIRALTECGRNDLIYSAATADTHPSYYSFVLNGETTLPEFWCNDARSRNHDMLGHIVEWMFKGICGINPDGSVSEPWKNPPIKHIECRYKNTEVVYDADKGWRVSCAEKVVHEI